MSFSEICLVCDGTGLRDWLEGSVCYHCRGSRVEPETDKEDVLMGYTTDWKPTEVENPDFKCQACGSNDIDYREWESSDGAHDDLHYRCNGCKRTWWVEGADA